MSINFELPQGATGYKAQQAAEAIHMQQEVEREQKKMALIDAIRDSLEDPTLDYNDLQTVQDLAENMYQSAIREEARKRLEAAKQTKGFRTLEVQDLTWHLNLPEEETIWRIEGLMQQGHNVTLAAQAKAGKTSMMVNLIKSLVDGAPFLGEFKVTTVTRPVVVFNYELDGPQFTRWLRKRGVVNTHLVIPVNLRGKGHYLQDEDAQDWSIELLRAYDAQVWIIDPLQAALRGTVNDDSVASEWIAGAERVKSESGVSELLLVTHTGHQSRKMQEANVEGDAERSAGSSRWLGWPDAMWTLAKGAEAKRFFSAVGREVDVAERMLEFHEDTWALLSRGDGTSRASERKNGPYRKVVEAFRANPDSHLTRDDIRPFVGSSNDTVKKGVNLAVEVGVIQECDCLDPRAHRDSSVKGGPNPQGYMLTGFGKTFL